MNTLHTFPYPDPALISSSVHVVRRISIPNCCGSFPIVPFIGIRLPSPAGAGDVRDYNQLSVPERIALGTYPKSRLRRPTELPGQTGELHALIGVGFYWWMKSEIGREFFGYPIMSSIPVNRAPLSRVRILRALHALQQLPAIDVCHDANTLSLCWAMAREEVEPRRIEKMINLFGYEVVLDLQVRLREYHPSDQELEALENFLRKGDIRASLIE